LFKRTAGMDHIFARQNPRLADNTANSPADLEAAVSIIRPAA